MINIDQQRCGYCGSCISVCPQDALTLQETRLTVGEQCILCGECVTACPMGALSVASPLPIAAPLSSRSYDVVVIGAGPTGSTAARVAAEAGISVLLVDQRQEIGSPVQCAEGVAASALAPFLEPDPRWISATIHRARLVAPEVSLDQTMEAGNTPEATGYILERRIFDRVLVERAALAGARILLKTRASGLLHEGGAVRGVELIGPQGAMTVAARLVITADGVGSRVARWAGLETTLPARDLMTCAQYLLAGIDLDPACTSYFVSEELAPGGYAWIFPKGEGRANVGLGVQSDLAQQPPLDYLTRFIERYPFLAQGSPVSLIVGGVPVALTPRRLVTGGLLVAGDAARQVDPLTGGGIISGMTAGQLAAEMAAEALAAGDTSTGFLQRYQARWEEGLGRRMARNYRLRERFPPGRRNDPRFLQLFAMSVGGGK